MGTLLKDDLMDAQALRALGYAVYGGADVGECVETARRITRVDKKLWIDEWLATAKRIRSVADTALAAGDRSGARSAYFRASNYFRTANIFALEADSLDTLRSIHADEVASFAAGTELLDLPPRIVAIPYQDTTLPGYFFAASDDGKPRATILLTNGYDGTAQELYFTNGIAALERGYNVLIFDGPGQGDMIIDRGIPLRPDWENVVAPVIDFALTLPEVDPARVVLHGLSFGGYLAPRAATVEHRLAACISDCGPYDLYDASASRIPAFLRPALTRDRGLRAGILNRLLGWVASQTTAGWALRRNLVVHGVTTERAFFELAVQYSLKGLESSIRCPTFVCAAETDDLSTRQHDFFDALTCEKEFVLFRSADGAGSHCEGLARALFHATVFAWLDGVLDRVR